MAKRSKYQGFGTIQGVKRVLWQILQKVSAQLSDDTVDDESQRGWANTGIQASLAYAKLQETHVLQQDLDALKDMAQGNGRLS